MSRASDRFAALGIALALAGAAHAAARTEPVCDGGVCTLNVDASQAVAPCAGAPILLAWRQEGGAALVQCATTDGELEQPSFVFDRRHPAAPAYDLQGVRFMRTSALADAASSHGLCKGKAPHASTGDIVLTRKIPSSDDMNPYCALASLAVTTDAGVAIRGTDPDMPRADAAHGDWDKLAAAMVALIPAPADASTASADTAHVVHAKAPLRDAPDLGSALHGYLVQGDAVTILDRSHAADGWVKARYAGKSGAAIERWIRADDLGLVQPAATAH